MKDSLKNQLGRAARFWSTRIGPNALRFIREPKIRATISDVSRIKIIKPAADEA